MPLYKLIEELENKDLWSCDVHDIKEIDRKPYCKFQKNHFHKADDCMASKYYLKELNKLDNLAAHRKLEKEDLCQPSREIQMHQLKWSTWSF